MAEVGLDCEVCSRYPCECGAETCLECDLPLENCECDDDTEDPWDAWEKRS